MHSPSPSESTLFLFRVRPPGLGPIHVEFTALGSLVRMNDEPVCGANAGYNSCSFVDQAGPYKRTLERSIFTKFFLHKSQIVNDSNRLI